MGATNRVKESENDRVKMLDWVAMTGIEPATFSLLTDALPYELHWLVSALIGGVLVVPDPGVEPGKACRH